ncbi:MAG: archease [Actinomycetota bacterium]|nr:archease [Actinomycetota bacterium]
MCHNAGVLPPVGVYRWVEHTGELELELSAPTVEGVFSDALEAMRELLEDDDAGEPMTRSVQLHASDPAALLADWVGELAFLAETEGLVPERAARLELHGGALTATVEGHRGDPPHLVKAATYHRLALEQEAEGWRGRVVLDV